MAVSSVLDSFWLFLTVLFVFRYFDYGCFRTLLTAFCCVWPFLTDFDGFRLFMLFMTFFLDVIASCQLIRSFLAVNSRLSLIFNHIGLFLYDFVVVFIVLRFFN